MAAQAHTLHVRLSCLLAGQEEQAAPLLVHRLQPERRMHDVILEAMLAMPAEAAVTSAHPRWFQRSQLRLAHLQQPHALLVLLQRVKLGGRSLHW